MKVAREFMSVEDTAMDAANAKWSAVSRGYYTDPYIEFFVPNKVRQLPPMNLGYYLRTKAICQAIQLFYDRYGSDSQVVILGCGYDTLYWRFRDAGVKFAEWFEYDMEIIVERKRRVVSNGIFQPLENIHITVADLGSPDVLFQKMKDDGFSTEKPSLFIDECTLIYVAPDAVDRIIDFASKIPKSAFISYGMVRPDDPFGKMMVRNFNQMGAPLKGIEKYPTTSSHQQRFSKNGFKFTLSIDLNRAQSVFIKRDERAHLVKIEMQDDPDELSFMLAHYVLAIASQEEFFMSLIQN